jgi:hypothetical protein
MIDERLDLALRSALLSTLSSPLGTRRIAEWAAVWSETVGSKSRPRRRRSADCVTLREGRVPSAETTKAPLMQGFFGQLRD